MSRLNRWVPLAAVIALLAAAMLAAAFANPTIDSVPDGQQPATQRSLPTLPPEAAPTRAGSDAPPEDSPTVPSWVGWLLAGLCVAAVAFVIVLLIWMFARNRVVARRVTVAVETSRPPTLTETQTSVRAAVEEGLADLDDDGDPRRVVIACWARLEAAAAAAGTPREPGDTSTDLVARLLGTHLISGDVLAAFAAVYREARFATHTVDTSMRDQARLALVQLRDELLVRHD